MSDSFDLTKLDSNTFEHLVNALALSVLGSGHTGFGPGPDGGRDGYFEGEAPYPSAENRWRGIWYIQSKFHKPHLSKDAQKWLIEQIDDELKMFSDPNKKRVWPDIWIVATNIDPSGTPDEGTFDTARKHVAKARPELDGRFHIWGGTKIIQLLDKNLPVASRYRHFLTPGHVITALLDTIVDERANADSVLRSLIAYELWEHRFMRLDQAGSSEDDRPNVHRLYVDLPYTQGRTEQVSSFTSRKFYRESGFVMQSLAKTASETHIVGLAEIADGDKQFARESQSLMERYHLWRTSPTRARTWLIKGGPGQGKSTFGQCFCQVQRAALLLDSKFLVRREVTNLANDIRNWGLELGIWPTRPRIPLAIELKEYAAWYRDQLGKGLPTGILTFVAEELTKRIGQNVSVGLLRRLISNGQRWVVVFDGLDEVPKDVKDSLSKEVIDFVDDLSIECGTDLLTICTSRPQGYSGQFDTMDGICPLTLDLLPAEIALECARPVLRQGRTNQEFEKGVKILTDALAQPDSSMRQLMATPLQAHIMAVVVRGGDEPPNRRWKLFNRFYEIIYKREANRNLPDREIAALLRNDSTLIRSVHNRLGFVLHARAETGSGARSFLSKTEFKELVALAVKEVRGYEDLGTVEVMQRAATERLVLINTPDSGDHVRFDIRQLQEYFAAEYLYENTDSSGVGDRLRIIAEDSHWQEVALFLLSGLVEQGRTPDIIQAVSVLNDVNDGHVDGEISVEPAMRAVARRLARGAFYAMRLLREGVLEEDARLRERFRSAVLPIFGVIDEVMCTQLALLPHRNSNSWLEKVLEDSIKELNSSEVVSAICVLGVMGNISSNEKDANRVINVIECVPLEYQWFLLESISKMSRDIRLGGVLYRIMYDLLFQDSPVNRDSYPQIESYELKRFLSNLEWPDVHLTDRDKKIAALLAEYDINSNAEYDAVSPLKIGYYKVSWVFGTEHAIHSLANSYNLFTPADGIIELGRRIAVYHVAPSFQSFADIRDWLNQHGWNALSLVSWSLRALVPGLMPDYYQGQLVDAKNISKTDYDALLLDAIDDIPYSRPVNIIGLPDDTSVHGSSLDEWAKIAKWHPDLLTYAWRSIGNTKSARARSLFRQILISAKREPDILLDIPLHWPSLLNASGSKRREVEESIYNACQRSPMTNIYYFNTPDFTSQKPEQYPLKSDCVLSHLAYNFALLLRRREGMSGGYLKDDIISHIKMSIGSSFVIDRIMDDKNDDEIRSACIILLWIMSESQDFPIKVERFWERFIIKPLANACEIQSARTWIIPSVVEVFVAMNFAETGDSRWLIGELLLLTRDDIRSRVLLEDVLGMWRRSTASSPVQRGKYDASWLNSTIS